MKRDKKNTTKDVKDMDRKPGHPEKDPVRTVSSGKYLTFEIDSEIYGLYVMSVREIIGMVEVTRVPRTPEFVRGVVNLRGKVIPVIDLKKRFNAGVVEETVRTPIIIVEARSGEKLTGMGLLVDHVSDVINVNEQNLEPLPSFGIELDTSFIDGIVRNGEDVITLLNIDRVLTSTELIDIRKMKKRLAAAGEDK